MRLTYGTGQKEGKWGHIEVTMTIIRSILVPWLWFSFEFLTFSIFFNHFTLSRYSGVEAHSLFIHFSTFICFHFKNHTSNSSIRTIFRKSGSKRLRIFFREEISRLCRRLNNDLPVMSLVLFWLSQITYLAVHFLSKDRPCPPFCIAFFAPSSFPWLKSRIINDKSVRYIDEDSVIDVTINTL